MPERDADRAALVLAGLQASVREATNPRAPGADRREARYSVPALHVQTGVELAYLAGAALSWTLALVVAFLGVPHAFPGR